MYNVAVYDTLIKSRYISFIISNKTSLDTIELVLPPNMDNYLLLSIWDIPHI